MASAKGKEKVTDGGKGKRKWSGAGGGDNDKTGQKRKNRGVVQFFDDRAYEVGEDDDEDSSDDSMLDYDYEEEEFAIEGEVKNEPGKPPQYPCFPKEEEMSEEELERMLEERYKTGSTFVTYAEDGYEHKRSTDRDIYLPSAKDPTIWKVKCMVGRERHSAFCLMQKFADLNYLGTKLQIISAIAVDHVKGFIYIEADKQYDINEACKGLCTVYPSRVARVPPNEIHHLLSVRSKPNAISEGMWARVKNGKYKGDLAQVVAVNDARKKVTVKLIPRIDLRAMAEKFGGGIPAKRTAIPAARLISSSELEEFRPLIQYRRDRDTNQMFEILDGMLLKDGYLYKKVSIDSLSLWGVMPTDDELLKFEPSKNDESNDGQWLSQLFGEQKKKHVQAIKKDKGGGKEGGSCSSTMENNFEMHDLVFFGRKDFGVVIGTEKDDSAKVIKEGSEGPSVVTVKQRELKSASFDKKLFTVLDQHAKTISINDVVRVLDGPLKDKQGSVKKIYKGILFLCDESEQENNGYICVKAQLCEKINISGDASKEKGSEPGGPSGFEDLPSSPKSPLSPKNSWQERDNKDNCNREDSGMFSVGQLLRIRLGPLKGYLCRVLAVRRSEVTVKLDSQHKILTGRACKMLLQIGRMGQLCQQMVKIGMQEDYLQTGLLGLLSHQAYRFTRNLIPLVHLILWMIMPKKAPKVLLGRLKQLQIRIHRGVLPQLMRKWLPTPDQLVAGEQVEMIWVEARNLGIKLELHQRMRLGDGVMQVEI
ncbi:Putative transcription elongation factor SPT5 homolog 1 [Olea europaea subsp. europaea]|uniref:Transcription elongation factor SPT5 homolog 1 n=1 Tax=Olea europaea subsp. europaea TaxID=158383 RepID=A0A8S0R0S0_OLEEU|nr:Putative transcription elongation factor SPT5 homolog 1 [Olea europaea subsp. europaea]